MQKILLIGLAFLFILPCCKNRCKTEKIGEVALLSSSKSYVPYDSGEVLIYEKSDGQEMEVSIIREYTSMDKFCVKYSCEPIPSSKGFVTEPGYCDYYDAECIQNYYNLSDQGVYINLSVFNSLYEEGNTLFYDGIQILMEDGSLAQGDYVLEPQFTTPTFNDSKISYLEKMVLESSVTLNGIDYENVLRTTEGENMVYIQAGAGIIGIKLDGEIWLLQ